MAKHTVQAKPPIFARDKCSCIATSVVTLIFCAILIFSDPWSNSSGLKYNPHSKVDRPINTSQEEHTDATFYDDPETRYTIDKAMINWDEKRKEWLKHHEKFEFGAENRVLVVTGSQPSPCNNPLGDHLLLRFFKNKVDYCRIHDHQIFYNNVLLDPKMGSFWAKIPVIRVAMLAHPETEWIFWVDSDAIFTDMDFKIPLNRYKDHNIVVHGWPNLIYEKRSWVAINAGIFLIRNCQWSMDFLDVWANMGPKSPDYKKWGPILKSTLKDKMFPESDDQSALVYLLLKEKKKWGDMIYIENEYTLHGYWLDVIKKIDKITKEYTRIEKREPRLRRRHAEVVRESYAALRAPHVAEERRPFITHFTGCQPCSGDPNPAYVADSCWLGMERAFNFADNQVLRNYGFMHPDLGNGSYVEPVPFDFPGDI